MSEEKTLTEPVARAGHEEPALATEIEPAQLVADPPATATEAPFLPILSKDPAETAAALDGEEPVETTDNLPTSAPDMRGHKKLVPGPEKGLVSYRTKEWYRDNLDWSKSTSELGKLCGVTRQRIAQLKKQLFPDGKIPPAPEKPFTAPAEQPPPDFSDITGEPPPAVELPPGMPEAAKIVDYNAMASLTFDMSTGLLTKVFGPEWQASSPDERAAMVTCIKTYYESKQLPDIPPGLMLLCMVAMYSAPRLAQQNTRSKLTTAWYWFKHKLGGLFRRKTRPQAVPGPAIFAAQPA